MPLKSKSQVRKSSDIVGINPPQSLNRGQQISAIRRKKKIGERGTRRVARKLLTKL